MKKINFLKGQLILIICFFSFNEAKAQESVARQWNEVLMESIRNDFARPTVHARNLFHISAAMYDAWAVYDDQASTYLLGNTVHGLDVTRLKPGNYVMRIIGSKWESSHYIIKK